MRLFLIQDDDRPAYVVAETFEAALIHWRRQISKENNEPAECVSDPTGIQCICGDNTLILVCDAGGFVYNGLEQETPDAR